MGKPCMIVTIFQITIFNLQFCVILDKAVNRIALSNLKLYLEYTCRPYCTLRFGYEQNLLNALKNIYITYNTCIKL